MRAMWNETIIAESDDTIVVEGNHYFPEESVDEQYLRHSDHTSECGWKGTAHYYSVSVDGKTNTNAAWYYPTPKPAASEITGRIAFWKGIEVR